MREPVLLKTCGKICDKTTMKRILLNDEHDPFNRAPLKISDLVDDEVLKERIERWIK
jgi:ubiquitin conjugation factor E4 B